MPPFKKMFGFLNRTGAKNSQESAPSASSSKRSIPHSETGSDPLSMPADFVGMDAEVSTLSELLEDQCIVFLHGLSRIGKTYLIKQLAQTWKENGRPFLYTCPSDQGIGDLFEKLGRFFWANGYEAFKQVSAQPESNDDDRIKAIKEPLKNDKYLLVLDSFERVGNRATFRKLVSQMYDDGFQGRLLVCGRTLPPWYRSIPQEHVGVLQLQGMGIEDALLFGNQVGFGEQDMHGIETPAHPFVLELLLNLAQQRQTTPGLLWPEFPSDEREKALLAAVCENMEEKEALYGLSVLRRTFLPRTVKIFGGNPEQIQEKPLSLLIGTARNEQLSLHPFVRKFGEKRLEGQEAKRCQAHEKALVSYETQTQSRGKTQMQSFCEMGHHYLELGRPRDSLEVLAKYSREITSFGCGWPLLELAERIEKTGIAQEEMEPRAEGEILHDLALIYTRLPVIEIDQNHLKAIRYCGRAVTSYKEIDAPIGLAQILNLQGMACEGLPIGDPRKNIHRAFESYQEALAIYQEHGLETGQAIVHNNMGTAWMKLSGLGGEWCVGRAVGHFKQAVKLYEKGVDPYTRARVEANLGQALCQLGKAEEGMEHFGACLEFFTREYLPREWASTQKIMGDANRLISSGNRIARLKQAIEYYAQALTVFEEEIFPEDFAVTQHYVGVAHRQLAVYENADTHRKLTIKCYQNALRVYTKEKFPYYHQIITENLIRDIRDTKPDDEGREEVD